MLTAGVEHLAVVTTDTGALHRFYQNVFDAEVVRDDRLPEGGRLSFVRLGESFELNVFELAAGSAVTGSGRMFQRGGLDHFGLRARDITAFKELRRRLVEAGASDGFVTDFGPVLSVFFRAPDGLEAEVCVDSPYAQPGVFHPPGTAAAGF